MDYLKKNVRYFPFLTLRKSWPWRFETRLVYSILCYRSIRHSGANKSQIARETSLSRTTVSSHLLKLQNAGLVEQVEDLWQAIEPKGDLSKHFSRRKSPKGSHWAQRLQSDPIFVPSSRFQIRTAALYSQIISLSDKRRVVEGTSDKHLAVLLHLSPATINRCLSELVEHGLVSKFEAKRSGPFYALLLEKLKEHHLQLFAGKGDVGLNEYPGLDEAVKVASGRQPQYKHAETEESFQMLLEARVPRKLAIEIMKKSFDSELSATAFRKIIRDKSRYNEIEYREARSGPHPGFLVRSEIEKRADNAKIRMAELTRKRNQQRDKVLADEARRLADPSRMSPAELRSPEAVMARVEIKKEIAKKTIDWIEARIRFFDFGAKEKVFRHILNSVNKYHGSEKKASAAVFVRSVDEALIKAGCEPIFQEVEMKPSDEEGESETIPENDTQDSEDLDESCDDNSDFGIRIEFDPVRLEDDSSDSTEEDLLRQFCNS